MSWKKAVLFGGAVLVLSACSSASAPTSPSLSKVNGGSAALKNAVPAVPADTSSTNVPNPILTNTCSGMIIHVGLDGTLIPACTPIEQF